MTDPATEATTQPVWTTWSSERALSTGQKAVALLLLGAFAAGLVLNATATLATVLGALTLVFFVTTGWKSVYLLKALRAHDRPPDPPEAISDEDLPPYTVMVALYHEANVVPALLDALARLDYPADRLEVLLLVEDDDPDTAAACQAHLRAGWSVVVVPPGTPKTKPRALNHGLAGARGELFTIFDAEDRPDPDQLRRAAEELARMPANVACLQARLDFYNEDQNVLTRWFTCDYAVNFGLYLRGISEFRDPMPLGGTSTHFRTAVVREVGGWDAYNVTEDCELGMRLIAAGYESHTLDSTTWEEAMPRLRGWVRQRSRWVKGFAQTGLALLRSPIRAARAMGPKRYLAALTTVAGVPVILMAQPMFWALLILYIALRSSGVGVGWIEALFPEPLLSLGMISLLVGNFLILIATVSAVYQQERYRLVRYALVIPVYWLLASVGAWRGVLQLIWKPHFWEKTAHGLATGTGSPPAGAVAAPAAESEVARR